MKCKKQPALVCPIGVISEQVLNRWRCLVAFMKAMNLFQWAMHVVYYHRIAMTIETAIKWVHILHLCFVCCRPGSRQSDKERVVTRWQCPVASGVALDMLHWAMPHVLLQRLCMAILMACRGGAFVRHRRLFRLA
jgi:hypothetical protein